MEEDQSGLVYALERLTAAANQANRYAEQHSSDIYIPFEDKTTITGTATASIWTPKSGYKFRLRGFDINAVIRTTLAAGGSHGMLQLLDNSASDPLCVITTVQGTEPAGNAFHKYLDLGNGILSGAADRVLKIGVGENILGGIVMVSGVVWGTEVQ